MSNIYLLIAILIAAILAGIFYYFYSKFSFKAGLKKALSFKTLLISLPKEGKPKEGEQPKDFKEVISVFEQLLSNIYGIGPKQQLSLEIITKDGAIYFYLSVPKELLSLVEKQIHSFYPTAQIEEDPFFRFFKKQEGCIKAAYLTTTKNYIYPLKTYLKLESEPLNALTNALSKLGETSQAAIQVILKPKGNLWQTACQKEARKIQEGKRPGEGQIRPLLSDLAKTAKGESLSGKPGEPYKPPTITPIDEAKIKSFQEKGQKSGFDTQIRVLTVAPSLQEAELHLNNIISAFTQFSSSELNSTRAIKLKNPTEAVKNFILKSFGFGPKMILNTEEITSIFHFPNQFVETPKIHWLLSKRLSAPENLPKEGTLVGLNIYRGEEQQVKIKEMIDEGIFI